MEVTNPGGGFNANFSNFSLVDWTVPFLTSSPIVPVAVCVDVGAGLITNFNFFTPSFEADDSAEAFVSPRLC